MFNLEKYAKLILLISMLFGLNIADYLLPESNQSRFNFSFEKKDIENKFLFQLKKPDIQNQNDYIDQTILEIEVNLKHKKINKPTVDFFGTSTIVLDETEIENITDYVIENDSNFSSFYATKFTEPYITNNSTSSDKQSTIKPSFDCIFPFIYNGKEHYECIINTDHNPERNESWCSLTANYDEAKQWKYCRENLIYTTGGNSNGDPCHFPFIFNRNIYNSCIFKEERLNNGFISYVKFCATSYDFDMDKRWGNCLDYSDCYFPFNYNNNLYTSCITSYLSASFCSLTSNLTRDKMWINCPSVCEGYPEVGQVAVDFHVSGSTCHMREHIYHLNGLKLRDYATPPCKLKYKCAEGFKSLYSEINCKLDGKYDRKALCIPI